MAKGHSVRLPIIGTILSWPILFCPINLQGLTLVQSGGEKKGYVALICIYLFVSKDIKTSIRNYKHGTFPFYSSFIKVETDLMCMRRNFSFCVLSPNKVSKKPKKKIFTGSHPAPFFALVWQQKSLQLAKRCFLEGFSYIVMHVFWMGAGRWCSERSVASVPYPAVPCTFPQHAALIHPGQWVRSRRCHCLLFVHFSFFFKCNGARKGS